MYQTSEVPDDVWCFLVARRAVARACLHLGITATSQEALDTLAEALLAYLERISGTVATAVEASRRSTANVLDVLNGAVPLCTTPAVQRVYNHGAQAESAAAAGGDAATESAAGAPSTSGSSMRHASSDPAQDLSWKGLAAFMFGPDWNRPLTSDEASEALARYSSIRGSGPGGAAGGKVGPSSLVDSQNPRLDSGFTATRGWCAPYPDKLPAFPTSKRRTAPSMGLYDDEDDAADDGELGNNNYEAVPDQWLAPNIGGAAGVDRSKRRRREDGSDDYEAEGAASSDEKAPKRVRIISDKDPASHHNAGTYEHDQLYLPRFLPPFPAHRDGARTVLEAPSSAAGGADVAAAAAASAPVREDSSEPGLRVRSALVSLHPDRPTYDAGSGWWEGGTARTPLLSVPWGRPTGDGGPAAAGGGAAGSSLASSSSAVPSPSAAATASAAAQIVPLGRASGSRVSRILEGSMDVP